MLLYNLCVLLVLFIFFRQINDWLTDWLIDWCLYYLTTLLVYQCSRQTDRSGMHLMSFCIVVLLVNMCVCHLCNKLTYLLTYYLVSECDRFHAVSTNTTSVLPLPEAAVLKNFNRIQVPRCKRRITQTALDRMKCTLRVTATTFTASWHAMSYLPKHFVKRSVNESVLLRWRFDLLLTELFNWFRLKLLKNIMCSRLMV